MSAFVSDQELLERAQRVASPDFLVGFIAQNEAVMTEALRGGARAALEGQIGYIMSVLEETFAITDELRARAAPIFDTVEGIKVKLEAIANQQTELDNAIGVLEPYNALPEVKAVQGLLYSLKPVVLGVSAAEAAGAVLAALQVPTLSAITAAAQVLILEQIEARIQDSLNALLRLLE